MAKLAVLICFQYFHSQNPLSTSYSPVRRTLNLSIVACKVRRLPEYANTRACFTCKAFRGEATERGTTVTASAFEGGAFPSTTSLSALARRPNFLVECRRQSRLVAQADNDTEMHRFMDEALEDVDGWTD